MLAIQSVLVPYLDLDGSPLDNGFVYFGVAGQNPETNPLTVFWDSAGTQPASQPIKTLNGSLSRDGTPAIVFCATDYSITVKTKKGVLVYNFLSSSSLSTALNQAVSDIAGVKASFDNNGLLLSPKTPVRLSEKTTDNVVTDWNSATVTGYYSSAIGVAHGPDLTHKFMGFVLANDANNLVQTVVDYVDTLPTATATWERTRIAGVWGAWYLLLKSQAETDLRYAPSTTIGITYRQTVVQGPLSAAGAPNWLPNTSVSLGITAQNISGANPLTLAFANGIGASGNIDLIAVLTANVSWALLTLSTTNYLGFLNTNGVITQISTILAPIYQMGGTISVVNGQYTFDRSQMKMFLGNGTTASQVNALFVAEVITNATTVTSSIIYAHNGLYDSSFINTLPGAGVQVAFASNLGVPAEKFNLFFKNIITEGGFVVGDIIGSGISTVGSSGAQNAPVIVPSRNATTLSTGAFANFFITTTKTGGVGFIPTQANWSYRLTASRGW